jgi:pimeloyl-ACP methyl ester carboxylesterase
MSYVRGLFSLLAGLVAGAGLNVAIVGISTALYPPPADLAYEDVDAMAAYVSALPAAALVIVLAGHLIGTLFGAWLAARLAGRRPPILAAVVAAVFLLAGIANLVSIPHPLWFAALDVLTYPTAGFLAWRLAGLTLPTADRPA